MSINKDMTNVIKLKLLDNDNFGFDTQMAYPELEALMWKYATSMLTYLPGYVQIDIFNTSDEFVHIGSDSEMFCKYFGEDLNSTWCDIPSNYDIWTNSKFAALTEREALVSSIFIMDNKVSVHTRNTYKYCDWAEIIGGALNGEGLSDTYFSLLTDCSDGVPFIGLYREAVAGVYVSHKKDKTVCIVVEKNTAICLYHIMYAMATKLLPTLPYTWKDFDHSNTEFDDVDSVSSFKSMCDHIETIEDIKKIVDWVLSIEND